MKLINKYKCEIDGLSKASCYSEEQLKNNNFDLRKTLSNLNLQEIAPIIKEFIENNLKNRPAENLRSEVGLSPIINVADNEIVQTLNKYFYQD